MSSMFLCAARMYVCACVAVAVVVYAACLWRDCAHRAQLESRSVRYCCSPSPCHLAPSIAFRRLWHVFALKLNSK